MFQHGMLKHAEHRPTSPWPPAIPQGPTEISTAGSYDACSTERRAMARTLGPNCKCCSESAGARSGFTTDLERVAHRCPDVELLDAIRLYSGE